MAKSSSATRIFVFGSNLAGLHGAGSARAAVEKHGAKIGLGVGLCGNSYAIPTKDCYLEVLSLEVIQLHVEQFLDFALMRPDLQFDVVAIGCGLAGFTPEEIAPMFYPCPANVHVPKEFEKILEDMELKYILKKPQVSE